MRLSRLVIHGAQWTFGIHWWPKGNESSWALSVTSCYITIVTMAVGSPPILSGLLPAGVVWRFGTPNAMVYHHCPIISMAIYWAHVDKPMGKIVRRHNPFQDGFVVNRSGTLKFM